MDMDEPTQLESENEPSPLPPSQDEQPRPVTQSTTTEASTVYQIFHDNVGSNTFNQAQRDGEERTSRDSDSSRIRLEYVAWASLVIAIIAIVVIAFILGRITATPSQEPTFGTVPVIITSTQSLSPDVNDQLRLFRGDIQTLRDQTAALSQSQISADEIKALRDQIVNFTRPSASAEWPTTLLIIVFAIACLVFAGYVLTRPSTNKETDDKARVAARVALISAIVAGILIPVSQNLSSLVPTPVWPCAFHPNWCGFIEQGTSSLSSSGTITTTVTPDATPLSGLSVVPTATFSTTPIPTAFPTIQLTSTPSEGPTPTKLETPSLNAPSVPAIINNYIYPDQCCIPTCRTISKAPCLTPTLDP
jgi:hypothetical protein